MSELVDPSLLQHPGRAWLRRLGVVSALLGMIVVVVFVGLSLSHVAPPKKQVAKIMLLPDTPPPPPPPPPDKPKIEPKNEVKQQQPDKPKVETPPEPQQLKMEGPAGEGPSPFAAGEVKNDYIGGDIGNGQRFAVYLDHVAQAIQEELTRHKLKVPNAKLFVWVSPGGEIQRYEIQGVSGDTERQLRTAMAGLARFPEPPPQDMPMPVGLEISGR
jgi:protein TonB